MQRLNKKGFLEKALACHPKILQAASIHHKYRKRRTRLIPRVPSVSLSLCNALAWSTECRRYKIPSIQVCDAQSVPYTVSHPIIGSQDSPIFGPWLLHITGEASSAALISGFLDFTNQTKELVAIKPHTQSFNNRVYRFNKHYFDNLLLLYCRFQNTFNLKQSQKNKFMLRFFIIKERIGKLLLRKKCLGFKKYFIKYFIKRKKSSLKPRFKKIKLIKGPREVKIPLKLIKKGYTVMIRERKQQKVPKRKQYKPLKVTRSLRIKRPLNVIRYKAQFEKYHSKKKKVRLKKRHLIVKQQEHLIRNQRKKRRNRYFFLQKRKKQLFRSKSKKIKELIEEKPHLFIKKKQTKRKTFFFTKKKKIVREYKNKTGELSKTELYNKKLKVALYEVKKNLIENFFIKIPLLYVRPVFIRKLFSNRGRTRKANHSAKEPTYFNFSESKKTKRNLLLALHKVRDMKNYIFFQYKKNKNPLLLATRKLLRINKSNTKYQKQFLYKISEYYHTFKDRKNLTFIVIKSLFWRQFIINIKKVYLQLLKLKALFGRKYFFKHFKRIFFKIIRYYKAVLVHCLGLRKALRRKRKQKRRYLTNITFHPRDLKTKFIVSFINLRFNGLFIKKKPLFHLKKVKTTQNLRKLETIFLKKQQQPKSNIKLIHGLVNYIFTLVKEKANKSYKQEYDGFFKNMIKTLPTKEYNALFNDNSNFHGKDLGSFKKMEAHLTSKVHNTLSLQVLSYSHYLTSILSFPRKKKYTKRKSTRWKKSFLTKAPLV